MIHNRSNTEEETIKEKQNSWKSVCDVAELCVCTLQFYLYTQKFTLTAYIQSQTS